MPPFPVPSPGDKLSIPAELWRRMMSALDYVEAMKRATPSAEPGRTGPTGSGTVRVTNASGSNQPQFAVLGIDGVFPTPTNNLDRFKAGPSIRCVTPDIDDHRGKFVILQRPALSGQIVPAVVAGATLCKVDVTAASHQFAEIEDANDDTLVSSPFGGARILWRESGTGDGKWAVVLLGPAGVEFRWGKLDGDLSSGSSATLSLWGADGEAWGSDTTENVTVYSPPVQSSTIATGSWLRIYRIAGGTKWIADLAGCPT